MSNEKNILNNCFLILSVYKSIIYYLTIETGLCIDYILIPVIFKLVFSILVFKFPKEIRIAFTGKLSLNLDD